jgi:hypothetical protein
MILQVSVFLSLIIYILNCIDFQLLKTRWVSGKRQYLVQWKDNSPSSWQYENDVSEALKAAFHTAKTQPILFLIIW